MKLTQPQLDTVHTKPHETTLHVSIFQPTPIFKCRVNDASIARNERIITYDTVTLGAYTDIKPGQTLLIGTSDGARDKGKLRIRSASATEIVVSENSNIDWANLQYLTVLKFWEVWPVYPRIIQTIPDPTQVIFYKDYDIAYTNQNSTLGTFANAGPHRAGELENGQKQFYYSAVGSENLLGTTLEYAWEFEGGSPATSIDETPGLVTYNSPGHYVTSLTITGTNCVDTTYRYVSVYPENGSLAGAEITEMGTSRGEGGATATIKLRNPLIDIYGGVPVIITKDDWFGATHGGISGNAPNSSDIFMVGYILKDTIRWNYAEGVVEFQIGSITQVMKKALGFSVSVESKTTPSTWFELKDMDARRAIYHYLKWHTTVLSVADFQYVGADYKIQYFDSDRESMFDAIDNLMRGTTHGQLNSDMQGKLWAEVDAIATPNAYTFFDTNPITRQDWMGQPYLDDMPDDRVSYLELGGIAYSGSGTGTFSALMACAPGDAPGFRGTLDRKQGMALYDQAQLNTLVGTLYTNANSQYLNLDMDMAGNYSFIDVAPQELLYVTIAPEDTTKGVALSSYYQPENISWTFNPETKFLYPRISLKQVLESNLIGQTIPIPDVPPDDASGGGGGGKLPPFPIITPATAILKLYGDNLISFGESLKPFEFAQAEIISSVASTYFQWPSSVQPIAPDAYIDILVPGVYRFTAAIADFLFGVEYQNSYTTAITWDVTTMPPGDYPGSTASPYGDVLAAGNFTRYTYTMSDIFFLPAGESVCIKCTNNHASALQNHTVPYIALTIERISDL